MSGKISIDRLTLERLYKKHKDYLIPIVTIIVCFILLVQITIPQIGILSQRQEDVGAERKKLDNLTNNLNLLSGLNDYTLDSQLSLSVSALPPEKNFASVLNTISLAAGKAGVFLGDFEFQVGDLSKIPPGKKAPSLSLALFVNGGVGGTLRFINELDRSLPLAEVLNIEVNNTSSTVTVVFYYKPFVNITDSTLPLSPLSKTYTDTLKEISTWNNPGVIELPTSPVASESGLSPTSPF